MKTIEPYKTSLSANNAYWMARMARVVYYNRPDDTPDEEKIIADLKAEDEKFISVTGDSKNSAQAMLVEHEDYFCLAFRGTNELNDWFDNFNVFLVKKLFGKFHRGFFNSVEDTWGPLFSKYQELRQKKKRPLFLTGHSLGGAMATVAAAKLIDKSLPFISVYTFGQPRAVEIATSRLFNVEAKSKFFRFHNNNDLVTRVPARLMGYSHVGTYIYISEEMKLHLEPGFWLRFLDSVDGAFDSLFKLGIDGVEDHSMDKYLLAVKNWDFA